MSSQIEFFNESPSGIALDEEDAKRILTAVMRDLGYPDFSINVISLEDNALREMKKAYFDQDVFTDIISFNIDTDPLEGELYISPERIRQNADSFNQPVEREFARILIHGACHLCGYDDISEEEKKDMTDLENRFLTQYVDK
jgi:rRNA maturation RNase YbeY